MVSWAFVELGDVDSTQAIAEDLASQGAPEGTTVVAKAQSSGVGRLGRRWDSPAGGLYMSFILRPGRIQRPELASLVGAVATADGIRMTTGLRPSIRWPNDLMVGAKKLGGVIATSQASKRGISEVVVGVGVNCKSPAPKVEGGSEATSIEDELCDSVEVSRLRRDILDSFSGLYEKWKAGEDVHKAWENYVTTPGNRVVVKLRAGGASFTAKADKIRRDGALVISTATVRIVVRPEDLEWLRELA